VESHPNVEGHDVRMGHPAVVVVINYTNDLVVGEIAILRQSARIGSLLK
jgi:hypothetical protein